MIEEIASYYNRHTIGKQMYSCVLWMHPKRLTASKLFALLHNKGLPPVANRLLLEMYTCQRMCTRWNGVKSKCFATENGVKQGGIFSPILFVCTLMKCWIASLLVSDAIWVIYRMHVLDTLTMSTYLRHLSDLKTICEKFAKEYHVIFNEKKSFCMRIGGNGTAPRRSVTMNGEPILWKSQIRHLGEFITHDLRDLNDITY